MGIPCDMMLLYFLDFCTRTFITASLYDHLGIERPSHVGFVELINIMRAVLGTPAPESYLEHLLQASRRGLKTSKLVSHWTVIVTRLLL